MYNKNSRKSYASWFSLDGQKTLCAFGETGYIALDPAEKGRHFVGVINPMQWNR
jgi:hypothetical protein